MLGQLTSCTTALSIQLANLAFAWLDHATSTDTCQVRGLFVLVRPAASVSSYQSYAQTNELHSSFHCPLQFASQGGQDDLCSG